MNRKVMKKVEAELEQLGLCITGKRNGRHLRLRLRNQQGVERIHTFPNSPSDNRWWLNNRSYLRAFAIKEINQ